MLPRPDTRYYHHYPNGVTALQRADRSKRNGALGTISRAVGIFSFVPLSRPPMERSRRRQLEADLDEHDAACSRGWQPRSSLDARTRARRELVCRYSSLHRQITCICLACEPSTQLLEMRKAGPTTPRAFPRSASAFYFSPLRHSSGGTPSTPTFQLPLRLLKKRRSDPPPPRTVPSSLSHNVRLIITQPHHPRLRALTRSAHLLIRPSAHLIDDLALEHPLACLTFSDVFPRRPSACLYVSSLLSSVVWGSAGHRDSSARRAVPYAKYASSVPDGNFPIPSCAPTTSPQLS
ncbi:hypothetical protein C8F04DRAFT_1255025 [Mycena alexandri]|uniref:Uncharacterized protein n=1 Tax=Mycena alexandri TaxID=1745969 RepID=A0AAD6T3V6_9AGAR|nr:hypothetical protein C8F04DRAFT_1255025 [Mycena alexandri]